MVENSAFRADLYYRLNVFPIRVPPLRERPEDIPMLVRHFVQQFSRRTNKSIETIPTETMKALVRYRWPGNIRELQNVIERAVIVSLGPALKVSLADLKSAELTSQAPVPKPPAPKAPAEAPASGEAKDMRRLLEETERKQILAALEQSDWIVAGPKGAAALLGLKRSTLQSRMQKLGIRISRSGT
jgi:formate hydrogenlyase transcriptional activator